ncbi:GntR family transcriptional regulator [Sinorhizobium sp. 7-81]|uniref:GntR family transcriptional regulator n=1 Tax=Sinorhizobium sp. 8-89 TaxID=3049089 RepID=UPI0024C2691F|nr:GntR family transcriptional regulator [Sinorhizobium sp. 8-89]MDK1494665.1 GntR family transcriptional regulator [Sinorhizobium sp. 8-89]
MPIDMGNGAVAVTLERGLQITMPAKGTVPSNETTLPREISSTRVYTELRHDILSMALPPSAPLDEVGLGNRFQLSRSPIREALVRLASEGLVIMAQNRSTIVAPLDFRSVPEYLDALDLLQRATHRSAAICRSERDIKEIDATLRIYEKKAKLSFDTRDWLPMIEGNYDFHLRIAQAGRNQYFAGFYKRILEEGRRMLYFHSEFLFASLGSPVERFNQHHREMVEAIREQNADEAERLAQEHAKQFKADFLDYMERSIISKMKVAM